MIEGVIDKRGYFFDLLIIYQLIALLQQVSRAALYTLALLR